MKFKRVNILAVSLFCLWAVLGTSARPVPAGQVPPPQQVSQQQAPAESEGGSLYGRGDVTRQSKLGDSLVKFMVGNVVIYHNGTVMTCDSAVQYNKFLVAGFKNVIVNKDDTYIYGDKIDYDTRTAIANIYSELVKTVDKDAVMYTRNMAFNTDTNVGYYTGGGTLLQKENRMESDMGYYYADTRDVVGIGSVQMRNEDYDFISDSVRYNMDEEVAHFTSRSYLWSKNDEFLTALRGNYDTRREKYTFTEQSYILTPTREAWGDTLIYEAPEQNAFFLGNCQLVDTTERAMAFGDYIRYWGESQNALLTRNPSVLRVDDNNEDTLFMRFDSIFLFSVHRGDTLSSVNVSLDSLVADSAILNAARNIAVDSADLSDSVGELNAEPKTMPETMPQIMSQPQPVSVQAKEPELEPQVPGAPEAQKPEVPGHMPLAGEAAATATVKEETKELSRREQRRLEREQRQTPAEKVAELQSMAPALHEYEREHEHELDADTGLRIITEDSLAMVDVKVPVLSGVAGDSISQQQDSMLRIIKGYYNGRIYSADMQALSDSMVAFSIDSTVHMYKNPLIWHGNNQVQAEYVDIFTKNRTIHRALFMGNPIMSAIVDSGMYNQVKGLKIEAFFNDGNIYRADVVGNAQTFYFMEETDSLGKIITGFLTLKSADKSFYFVDGEIDDLVARKNPESKMFPLDKIPEDQPMTLPGFEWQAHLRPSRRDVFDRVIRSTEREYYEALAKPGFPITRDIEDHRKKLIQGGVWIDRTDTLSPAAMEFLDNLPR